MAGRERGRGTPRAVGKSAWMGECRGSDELEDGEAAQTGWDSAREDLGNEPGRFTEAGKKKVGETFLDFFVFMIFDPMFFPSKGEGERLPFSPGFRAALLPRSPRGSGPEPRAGRAGLDGRRCPPSRRDQG